MKHAAQVDLMKKMLDMIDSNTTEDAGQVSRNPTSHYVDPEIARREWETMFANHPQVLGLSADLPEPGSFMTSNDLGIPILATRDKDGSFHAFVNACRHRGALLTEEARGKQHRFACPFHAWTYAGDGKLLGIREPKKFGDIDKGCNGLVELPSAEKYGLLVVHPQVDGTVDIDALLGEDLAGQLASWDAGRATYMGGDTLNKATNWKIANDTFGENYHFHTLHAAKLNNLFHGDATAYDEYGRNHRLTVASRYIDVMRTLPEEQWNVSDAGIVVYYLFPNVQLVFTSRVIFLFRIYPDPKDPGRSVTHMSTYDAPHIGSATHTGPAEKPSAEELYNADTSQRIELSHETQMEIMRSTLEEEDYHVAEQSQAAAASGKVEHFIFGRNEPALHHFHNAYRDALGMPPLEEYRPTG
ncbi:MAG: aromatic ring-hydroxylating oxygenase subunit alpha [Gammaproteobacteria bacterium]